MGVVVFTSTPSNPLAKFLLSVPMALCSAGLEIFAPKGRIISTRPYSNDSIELKVKTAAWPLQAPHESESVGKESYCARWGHQLEIELLIYCRGKEEYV